MNQFTTNNSFQVYENFRYTLYICFKLALLNKNCNFLHFLNGLKNLLHSCVCKKESYESHLDTFNFSDCTLHTWKYFLCHSNGFLCKRRSIYFRTVSSCALSFYGSKSIFDMSKLFWTGTNVSDMVQN